MHTIELRNIKYAAFASEETSCFQGVVYIDGTKVCDVSNNGKGACDDFCPWDAKDVIEKAAQANGDDADAEGVVAELLHTFLVTRDLQRLLKGYLLLKRNGDKAGQFRQASLKKWPGLLLEARANPEKVKADLKCDLILNLLPFEQALAIYREKGPEELKRDEEMAELRRRTKVLRERNAARALAEKV